MDEILDLLNAIRGYAQNLKDAAIWHNSRDIIAHVVARQEDEKGKFYIYEFYCYVRVLALLAEYYDIVFIPGAGAFRTKFPQAAADKAGKPGFDIYENNEKKFQYCGGTKINCNFPSENNHPDISFQKSDAGDDPCGEDVIIIYDAKYQTNEGRLDKKEVYAFSEIVELLGLRDRSLPDIFPHEARSQIQKLNGNCLLTNKLAHHDNELYLRMRKIKEVEKFYPGEVYNVKG